MERTTDLQGQGALGTGSLQLLAGLVDSLDIAADDQLAGVVLIGADNDVALAVDAGTYFFDFLIGQADDSSHR